MIISSKLKIVILLLLLAGLLLSSCAIFAEGIPLTPKATGNDPASYSTDKDQTTGQSGETTKDQTTGQSGETAKDQTTGQSGVTTKGQTTGQSAVTTKGQTTGQIGKTSETGSWAEEIEGNTAASGQNPDQEPVLPKNPATNPCLFETEPAPQPTPEPTVKPEPTPVPTKRPEPSKDPEPTPAPTTVSADPEPTNIPDPEPDPVPETEPARTVFEIDYAKVDAVFAQTNLARENNNLQPYAYPGADLLQAAALRAREAAEVYDRDGTLVSHDRPDGSSCFSVLGEYEISYSCAGENIFWGSSGFSAEEIVAAWLSSEWHRKNILSTTFTTVAVGFYSSGGLDFYVQIFIG